ncbi:unnamed protein product [Pleuronectes platessa]|uniref:Uncharacterized protein n=1 Tax=Pleuronectes platessa TaxID=8262 RepID=A0A9N7V4K5_PLEPL|nr:unnamed protein product [Pleuronectes platessa]
MHVAAGNTCRPPPTHTHANHPPTHPPACLPDPPAGLQLKKTHWVLQQPALFSTPGTRRHLRANCAAAKPSTVGRRRQMWSDSRLLSADVCRAYGEMNKV